jgi:cardiolipin synthase
MDASPLAKRNSLQLFTDGQEKFQALFEDIRAAKKNFLFAPGEPQGS